jgi:hypothetical protein
MYSYDRTARAVPFGQADVEAMRKDVLMLMKNVDKIELDPSEYDYSSIQKDYDTLRRGIVEWNNRFDEKMYKDFIPHISVPIRVWLTGSTDWSQYFQDQEKQWVDHWSKKLRTDTWGLHIELSGMPRIQDWRHNKKKWAEKVKREARKAWAILTEFIKWLGTRPDAVPTIEERTVEQTRLEGFQVTVIGYDGTDHDKKAMEIFKEGLKVYRSRASAVAPGLLKQQLPLVFRFDCVRLDLGAEYLGDHIEVCASANRDTKEIAKTLAHEMAHHLFKQLSGAQEEFWSTAIHQDFGDLDLHDVLAVWRSGESIWDLMQRMEDHDPVLALQLQGVLHGYSQTERKPAWRSPEDLKAFLDGGGNARWVVPKHPITGYASKNSEEAFCETVGMAVAYGPQTLDPMVRSWLDTIMPGQVKFSSRSV